MPVRRSGWTLGTATGKKSLPSAHAAPTSAMQNELARYVSVMTAITSSQLRASWRMYARKSNPAGTPVEVNDV